mgnify:CR=1 FL=1
MYIVHCACRLTVQLCHVFENWILYFQICGQNQLEEQEAEIYKAHNADDRILRTCLKLKAEGKQVVLYTKLHLLRSKELAIKVNTIFLLTCSLSFTFGGLLSILYFALNSAKIEIELYICPNRNT